MTDIAVINRGPRRIRDARYQALLPALQTQISRDFAPAWGADATLHYVARNEQPDPAMWKCWLLDTSDEPGDLGYHEDDTGTPEAKIFIADDLRYGASISVTISHELLEMIGDPLTTKMAPITGPNGEQYIVEVGDPVEADADGYDVPGADGRLFRVSNFAWPYYFGFDNPDGSTRLDQMNLLTGQCPTLRPGGYQLALIGGQWTTIAARYADGALSHRAIKPLGRVARRAAKST